MKALGALLKGGMDVRGWALMLAVLLSMSVLAWAYKDLIDFHVFYTAAARVWNGGLLYLESDLDMPFKYSPAVALVLSPLGLLPERVSAFLWLIATALVLARFIAWGGQTWFPEAPLWMTALVLLFIAPFHRHLIALGQCDVFILALVMSSEKQRKLRPFISGALLAMACAFKPPFLLFVLLIIGLREWRRLTGFLFGVLTAALLPTLRYGVTGTLEQLRAWQDTLQRTTAPMFCHPDNQSVFGVVCRLIVSQESAWFRPLSVALGAALFFLVATPVLRLKRAEERRTFALAMTFYLTASLSPLGWRTNLIGMVPLLFMLFAVVHRSTHPARWLLLVPPALSAFLGLLVFDLFGKQLFRYLVERRLFGLLAAVSAVAVAWAFTALAARSTSDSASRAGS